MKTIVHHRLILASAAVAAALSLHQGVLGNIAVQYLHASPTMYGLLTALKELPGLCAIALVGVATRLRPLLALAASALLIGIGISLSGTARSFDALLIYTVVMSIGLHVWYVIRDTTVMHDAPGRTQASHLGRMVSIDFAAGMAGMALVWMLSTRTSLTNILLVGGVFGLLAGALLGAGKAPAYAISQRTGLVVRKRYLRYYFLTVFSATREMVVITFASYLLLQSYHTSAQMMTLLLMIHSALAVVTRPVVGRIVDRFGQERSLAVNYIVLAAVFVGYALVHQATFAYLLYILDYTLAGFDEVAISSYAARMVDPRELAPSLAMGDTLAHTAAMVLPMFGGLMWNAYGKTAVFSLSSGLALLAAGYCLFLMRFPQKSFVPPAISSESVQ